jgi:hypothetical protein
LRKAQEELENAINKKPGMAPDKLPDELLDLIAGRNNKKSNGFLAISQRSVKFDPLVKAAIEELKVKHKIRPDEAKVIADVFVKEALAGDIDKVTQRLNRQRLSDVRRAVLNAVYPMILRSHLDGTDLAGDRRSAKDTIGLTETVLADLQSKKGPLADFAEILVDKTIEKMGINAPHGSTHHQLLVAQMRGSL